MEHRWNWVIPAKRSIICRWIMCDLLRDEDTQFHNIVSVTLSSRLDEGHTRLSSLVEQDPNEFTFVSLKINSIVLVVKLQQSLT